MIIMDQVVCLCLGLLQFFSFQLHICCKFHKSEHVLVMRNAFWGKLASLHKGVVFTFFLCFLYVLPCTNVLKLCTTVNTIFYNVLCNVFSTVICWSPVVQKILCSTAGRVSWKLDYGGATYNSRLQNVAQWLFGQSNQPHLRDGVSWQQLTTKHQAQPFTPFKSGIMFLTYINLQIASSKLHWTPCHLHPTGLHPQSPYRFAWVSQTLWPSYLSHMTAATM
jgi:hypothetical protein